MESHQEAYKIILKRRINKVYIEKRELIELTQNIRH